MTSPGSCSNDADLGMSGDDQLLLIRADAGPRIGVGHVMRCLALAQAWQDRGGKVALLAAPLPAKLRERLRREDVAVHEVSAAPGTLADASETRGWAAALGAGWLVVDGYHFGSPYLAGVSSTALSLLVVDDLADQTFLAADCVLNQNLSADAAAYVGRLRPDGSLLAGTRYALLRREFRMVLRRRPAGQAATRLLITMGGADAENFTCRILERLAGRPPAVDEVVVLAGAANPHAAELLARARSFPLPCSVRLDVPDVAQEMADATVAISGAGSTVWELACLGVPALVGAHERNQLAGLGALGRVAGFRALPIEILLASDLRAELSQLAPPGESARWIDADGALRVVDGWRRCRHRLREAVSA